MTDNEEEETTTEFEENRHKYCSIKAETIGIQGNMLRKITGPHNDTNIRYSNNALIIRTKSEEAKDYVISTLKKEKIKYTILNNDRDLFEKITIKGLPPSITTDEIKEELRTQDYPIENVR